jgi:(p)ppGpp synthase/HD superfamily hydrolase
MDAGTLMDLDADPNPVVGPRLVEAFSYAVELHANQARKSTTIPYVTHLMAVCSLALEDGADEDGAIAALLHDGPEDQGGQVILDEIRRRFGDHVAEMVEGLTDTLEDPKAPWRPRKEAYLERLRSEPEDVLRVSLADKLHNARSMLVDLTASPDGFWDRFSAGCDDQAWYFGELLRIFKNQRPPSRNLPEFGRVVDALFG